MSQNYHARYPRQAGMLPGGIYYLAEFIQTDGFSVQNGINTVADMRLKNNHCAFDTKTDILPQTIWEHQLRVGFWLGILEMSPFI